MIKYFCDTCEKEVKDSSQLSSVSFEEIDKDSINRYDVSKYINAKDFHICVSCRVNTLDYMKSLNVRPMEDKNERNKS